LRYLLGCLADVSNASRDQLGFGEKSYAGHDSMLTVGDPTRIKATGWQPTYDLSVTLATVVADVLAVSEAACER
jgi:hypothetical protein